MQPGRTTGKSHPGLGREGLAKIGHHLRIFYDDIVKEGVPDRFADLLRQLENKGEKGS
jgi:hypothetical protein